MAARSEWSSPSGAPVADCACRRRGRAPRRVSRRRCARGASPRRPSAPGRRRALSSILSSTSRPALCGRSERCGRSPARSPPRRRSSSISRSSATAWAPSRSTLYPSGGRIVRITSCGAEDVFAPADRDPIAVRGGAVVSVVHGIAAGAPRLAAQRRGDGAGVERGDRLGRKRHVAAEQRAERAVVGLQLVAAELLGGGDEADGPRRSAPRARCARAVRLPRARARPPRRPPRSAAGAP